MNSFNRHFSSMSDDLVSKYDKKKQKFKNIFPLIYDPKNLEQAWYEIKNNQNNIVNSYELNETICELELIWFKEISRKLELGTYNYHSARKVFLPKRGKPGKKALIISNPQDKVVQRAFLRVLQLVYEGVIH